MTGTWLGRQTDRARNAARPAVCRLKNKDFSMEISVVTGRFAARSIGVAGKSKDYRENLVLNYQCARLATVASSISV